MKKPKRIRPKLGVHPYYVLIALSEIVIAAGIALLLNWLLPRHRIVYILEKVTGGRYKAHEHLEHPRPKQ